MKTFCILEQGNRVGEDLTLKKKKFFTTEFSDFYRLNWSGKNDPEAFISLKGLTWSEGRSLLYEKVPKNYEYYIFCDDDINFTSKDDKPIAKTIRDLLLKYKPISATFLDINSWSFSWIKKNDISRIKQKETYPIAGFDLQVHIFQKDFADIIYPAIYHGSGRTLSYAQWFCHELFPYKQHFYSTVQVSNTRHELHLDSELNHFSEGEKVVWLFNRHIKDKKRRIPIDKRNIISKNSEIYNNIISAEKISISENDLKKVYNLDNYFYKNRMSISSNDYIFKMKLLDILWFLSFTRLRLILSKLKTDLLKLIFKKR